MLFQSERENSENTLGTICKTHDRMKNEQRSKCDVCKNCIVLNVVLSFYPSLSIFQAEVTRLVHEFTARCQKGISVCCIDMSVEALTVAIVY